MEGMERKEQQYEAELAGMRAAIDEGDASGVAEGNVFARVRETLALVRIQKWAAGYAAPGRVFSEELIEERRQEAAKEFGA